MANNGNQSPSMAVEAAELSACACACRASALCEERRLAIDGNQWQSMAIDGNQWQSTAINGNQWRQRCRREGRRDRAVVKVGKPAGLSHGVWDWAKTPKRKTAMPRRLP